MDTSRFDEMYQDGRAAATPWDIGRPQHAVERLAAFGAVRGDVLDPGTGPGHHAIFFASKGFRVTGVDSAPAAIELARRNARSAGVPVEFCLADATKLDGFERRFDTVVDSSFYHTLADEALQVSYLTALHRTTRDAARLFLFAFSPTNVNGFAMPPAVTEDNLRTLLPQAGWNITYLGATTHEINASTEAFEMMIERNSDHREQLKRLRERFRVIEPWLDGARVHLPFWEVHASRMD